MAARASPARVRRAQTDVRSQVVIAGAGMAGLVAAARSRELGAAALVYEKGSRAGGSMLLSSGFAWRYRSLDIHLEQCPSADERLAATIVDQFDDALDWLESLGVDLLTRETGNPLTTGGRFDPKQLVDVLARDIRLGETIPEPTILATGGFAARLARERGLLLRANPWSEGDGLDLAVARGAETFGDMGEFYGRGMPATDAIAEDDFVRLTQLYGRYAAVTSQDGGERFEGPPAWSETDLVQKIARWPGGVAWYTVEPGVLDERVRERTVREMIDAARDAGAPVREQSGGISVLVRAAVTHTIGGLHIDERARVLDERGEPLDGLFAAGVDAGGWSTGGYASGLSAALVFGRIAGESAAG
ncbi:MAG TPA: FAD-binding protein [Gaiellaceae bacterium]|nr:FAD-binding protein [Gaiellaceae bacterium]